MRRELRVADATVALARVHMDIPIYVLTIPVDDVFTSECVVLLKRLKTVVSELEPEGYVSRPW